ncbi:hypothetical protein TCE0_043f15812 [Talaromyces pinophilus]|uniref:Uncharacterized protein n=1 Tax=Talaromyces pinophilus TaxID=128442 RepID=A0A0B8MYT1_TALPI|nr:hypothetical protein TCE0_043f15812 [Talaromyces pinophilus]
MTNNFSKVLLELSVLDLLSSLGSFSRCQMFPFVEDNTRSETDLLSLWKTVYFPGFYISPPLAVGSALCSFVNAYITLSDTTLEPLVQHTKAMRLFVAGSLMLGVVPYTIALVATINRKMMKRHSELTAKSGKKEETTATAAETKRLVKKWEVLNYGRMLLPLTGAILTWRA